MKSRIVLLALTLACSVAAAQTRPTIRPSDIETRGRIRARAIQQDNENAPAAYVQQSVCLLQLVPDQPVGSIPLDQQALSALINSPGVIDSAATAVLKISADDRREYINVATAFNQRGTMVFVPLEVSIRPGCPNLEADSSAKLLEAITTRLSKYIKESAANQRIAFDNRRNQITADLEESQKQLAAVREKLRTARESVGINGGMDTRNQLMNWKSELRRLEMESENSRRQLKMMEASATQPDDKVKAPATRPAATQPSDILDNPAASMSEVLERVVMLRREKARRLQARMAVEDVYSQYLDALLEVNQAESERLNAVDGRAFRVTFSERVDRGDISRLRMSLTMAEAQIGTLKTQIGKVDEAKLNEITEAIPQLQNEESRLRVAVDNLNNQLNSMRLGRMESGFTLFVLGVESTKPEVEKRPAK